MYATPGSAGLDLPAAIEHDMVIEPYQRMLIPCGLSIKLPPNHEAQIRPRSGLAYEHGITVLNSPGTIDNDYTGEIKVLLINMSDTPFTVKPGMRIAQMVIAKYKRLGGVDEINVSRGSKGFGSTGLA